MNKPVGGRGKKAPYISTHIRIPEPIKDRVEELKSLYTDGNLEEHDELLAENKRLADEYKKSLTTKNNLSESQLNPLPSLEQAKQLAIKELANKKSARETVAKLLQLLYGETITKDDLK